MSLWTDVEFQRVAMSTRLSERSISACRAVLVDGMSGADAAKEYKFFHAQISRSLATLKSRQESMVESATHLITDKEALLKFAVLQIAKTMKGEGFTVQDALPGNTYDGPILFSSHGFVVQQVGRTGVLHDLGVLDAIPQLNKRHLITYPGGDGPVRASVSEINLPPAVSTQVGR